MSTGPELTVVVTSYNREDYLGSSIESVLASRFESFELLVVDDASTDRTVEIARSYAERDERVRVVVNEHNLGDYENRNHALGLVETPFLKYHDSDDLMYPHCLETELELLRREPEAGFTLFSGRSWVGGPCPMLLTPRMAYRREFLGGGLFHCGPGGAMFRTTVLRELGGFPLRGAASDFCFWLNACAVTPVVLVPSDLIWYRVHPGQQIQGEVALSDYLQAKGEAWAALNAKTCPLTGAELVDAKRSFVYSVLRACLGDLRSFEWGLVRRRFEASRLRWRDLLRYPPKRFFDARAGSPLDENGDYTVPDWVSPQAP